MDATLTILVIWSIVAMVFYCCYRLWYWTPMPTTQVEEMPEQTVEVEREAA